MLRALLYAFMLAAPAFIVLTSAGCEDKVVTVQQTEERHTSEPQMVSPGEEKVK